MRMISKIHREQLVLIRRRGYLNGNPELIKVLDVTTGGKFAALKVCNGTGKLIPFCEGGLVDVADFEIVDPIEASKKPNVDPTTGCPKKPAQE